MSDRDLLMLAAAVFAGVSVLLSVSRWAGPALAKEHSLLPGRMPWTESRRRRYNASVILRAVMFALPSAYVAWFVASAVAQ